MSNFSVVISKRLRPKDHTKFLRGYQKNPMEPMSLFMSLFSMVSDSICRVIFTASQCSSDPQIRFEKLIHRLQKIRGGPHGKQSIEEFMLMNEARL